MTRRGVMAATVVCLLAGCGGGGNASQTQTESATNGHIAFERLRFQNSPLWGELFVMNADGTGVRKLTLPPNGTEDTNPDWSPDGSRLVFERAPSTGAHSIWTVNSDGTGLRRLTPDCPPGAGVPTCRADDGWPVWSPDGKHIAFQRLTGALRPNGATVNDAKAIYKDELTIMDADGGHTRTLFWLGPWRGDPQAPAWSPDGKRLVFVGKFMNSKTNGTGCECRALYVIDVDGSGLNRILPPGVEPGVEWNGRRMGASSSSARIPAMIPAESARTSTRFTPTASAFTSSPTSRRPSMSSKAAIRLTAGRSCSRPAAAR